MNVIEISREPLYFQTDEAIKTLRANIQFSGYNVKAISFTSVHPNDGKSFVSFETANALADMGKKTIFLDCDIRNSVMQARLGVVKKIPGLSDFLVGECAANDIICQTNIPNLCIAFAGTPVINPSELLSSEMFTKLIDALKSTFDYVILDTAPLGVVIDAAVISKHSDGLVFVLNSGVTERRDAIAVKNQLKAAGVKVIGIVLNMTGKKGISSRRKKKNTYYGYGNSGGEKPSKKRKKKYED